MTSRKQKDKDSREEYFLDIDRMVNEGLGGGNVTRDNGLIEETTTDTMVYPESILGERKKSNTERPAY